MTTDQLATEFESFQGELKSFLLRMTASVQDAEDIVQDTYLKARAKLDAFRGESSLKTWVFIIASNLARDLFRSKKRWPETVTDICREDALHNRQFFQETLQIRETSPQGKFEIKEHIAFCFTCVSKSLPVLATWFIRQIFRGFHTKISSADFSFSVQGGFGFFFKITHGDYLKYL